VIAGGEVVAAGALADIRARAGNAQLEDAFVHLMGGAADRDKDGNGRGGAPK
jgi:ABC-type Na+ transport system ATPase subunit NatA